jgi:hypothetical protein
MATPRAAGRRRTPIPVVHTAEQRCRVGFSPFEAD